MIEKKVKGVRNLPMVVFLKVNMTMINQMGLVVTLGLMDSAMMVNGKMDKNMVLGCGEDHMENHIKENGT
jgi:hypothetical protein